jgi:hypothetical protein
MGWDTGLTLSATLIITFIGFSANCVTDLMIVQRKDRLERVNRRLKDFYGPLYALAEISLRAWEEFRRRYRPGDQPFWNGRSNPNEEEEATWRLWMRDVFMYLNL